MHLVFGFTCVVFIAFCIIFLGYIFQLVSEVKKIRLFISSCCSCGAALDKTYSFCPYCGRGLEVSYE